MKEEKKNKVSNIIVNNTKFTQDWMNGEDGLCYKDFSDSISDKFKMIMVNGQLLNKIELEKMMNHIKGKWNVKLSVEDIELTEVVGVIIATYIEIHKSENVDTKTRATSIFTSNDLV